MIPALQTAAALQPPLFLAASLAQAQSFARPRLRSRSAPPPTLLHHTPHAPQREKILGLPLVRGLGGDALTSSALRALTAGRTVHLAMFWGFRSLLPAEQGLNAAERNTLRGFLDMAQSLGAHCKPVLLLADAHAAHNGIPAALSAPYYDVVASQAKGLGLRTVMLSSIMASLGMTPQQLAGQGKALVLRPGQAGGPGATALTPDEWRQLKLQSRHLCARFPQVFPKPSGEKAKRALHESRALAYVQLRAAEGRHLLPALKACFGGESVLPVHLSDPATERLGVHGLHVYAMNADNERQVAIPWR
ncbi:hypothetical protein [Noviherbaspirillum suwonense]|uniref:Uncharacterized protein n=1 Tax=Noviherbaspirillum suwonense TaxID=1224511 RepID=A0ABY1QLH2_9BURK|nr:hypothetical protein [Noviherbaspirillum suwonense]SMP74683.1 hypothetical protein SAMN06295970_12165 [Noviherbaspirillum suwonense]